ncbi:uncharacterized protein BDR25DRAFT_303260, partial [Lindgomyces ingoldianus]
MAGSPDPNDFSQYFASTPELQTADTPPGRQDRLGVPETVPSRSTSPTQYEFITTTGEESATASKQKLKTVRSHVMKNYLQQQKGRGSGEPSLSPAAERRRGKQRARSSRSTSRETERVPISPTAEGRSVTAEVGSLFSGISSYTALIGGFEGQTISG